MRADDRLGVAAAVMTALLWGSNHVVARALREAVPLPSLVFWRWFLGAALLTMIGWPRLVRAWPQIRDRRVEIAMGGVIGVGLFSYLLLGGAYHSLALEVGLINATTPVWVALIGALSGQERPNARIWLALALAFAGTLVILVRGEPAALLQMQFGFGNLLSLAGAIVFAWFSLRVRVWSRTIDSLALTVATAWAGVFGVMAPAYLAFLATGGAWFATSRDDVSTAAAAIAYMAIGPTMLGNFFYLFGVGAIGATKAATFLYLSPLFSAALAIAFLGEKLAAHHIAGVLVIASGLWLLAGKPQSKP